MPHRDQTIVVTGATGQQGGAAARRLLADGWHVRALVRDPEKPAARALADAGVELVVGDLNDRASLDAALLGAYGAYSVQSGAGGMENEVTQSKNLADAADAAGVKHFVYSSVRGADGRSLLPWIRGKARNETYLRGLDLPVTIWRPVTFMENLITRQREGILGGKVTGVEPADVVHQWIAIDDIGRFVALAFREPEVWVGRATEIAGDEMTGEVQAEVLSRVLGRAVVFEQVAPPPGMTAPPAAAPTQPQARADIPALRKVIPDLRTLFDWAAEKHANGAW
jgi:uncharacterized protein YbjT (DUF2867 family)